ncbi:endolytic transglycosylase MltG [Marinivivus vitaminiproducens]|uniref:endolytic transglycosylase MltG n=1 Tax=Marinivivus vitaminiproducens TaxID=3035935 RepID=UPI0027A7EF10|nr:endolytic transglycosylase MltG [Geminicoccaceae bacterium SCSIO 64248]
MRRLGALVQLVLALSLLGLIVVGPIWAWQRLTDYMAAPGPATTDRIIDVPRGSGLASIAGELNEAGILERPLWFQVGARLTQRDRALKAGEYVFPAAISPSGILDLLESGKTVVRRITVAEGTTVAAVMAALGQAEGLTGDLPPAPEEGSLLPETYFYSKGDARSLVLERMTDAMDQALERAWRQRADDLPLETPEQALTLASVVEKETGVAAERPLVASVFMNRLRQGMRLQSDPTVIYALTEGKADLGRPLTRADWTFESPYNTYVAAGLPPGPIANPGLASIEAVLDPPTSNYLYFVADGSGGHAFARSLDEHNRNVARWRQVQRETTAPATPGG